jgi:hypothetical protein
MRSAPQSGLRLNSNLVRSRRYKLRHSPYELVFPGTILHWLTNRTAKARRMNAALLLAVLLSPFLGIWNSYSPGGDAILPACCRAHGKHHCSMGRMAQRDSSGSGGPALSQVSEKCPYQGLPPLTRVSTGHCPRVEESAIKFSIGQLAALSPIHFGPLYRTAHAHPKRGPPSPIHATPEA